MSSARAALLAPADERRRLAGGWLGAAMVVIGVVACAAAAAYLSLAYSGTVDVRSSLFIAVLMVFLAACLSLVLIAP